MVFNNAQEAFENLYDIISEQGIDYSGTKCLHNVGFEILNPLDNMINTDYRKWKPDYAELEWKWYLSENPNAVEIAKALLNDDKEEIIDAIGDCVVVLTNLSKLAGYNIEDCIYSAYSVIRKRTGKMENGTFIKDK
jgi:hypothetical protein